MSKSQYLESIDNIKANFSLIYDQINEIIESSENSKDFFLNLKHIVFCEYSNYISEESWRSGYFQGLKDSRGVEKFEERDT